MFGKRCFACGIYVKVFQRGTHERWHADQVLAISKILCNHCFAEHGKPHARCWGLAGCKCACNQVEAE